MLAIKSKMRARKKYCDDDDDDVASLVASKEGLNEKNSVAGQRSL
jgi:hypothetical protein